MFEAKKILISREGVDADHDYLKQVPGLMIGLPSVGESLQMFLDNDKVMRTSPVTRVDRKGNEFVVDTRNSRYRLKLAA